MAKPQIPNNSSKKRMKWVRYVLLGVAGFGLYHILSGPSGVLNIMKLRQSNGNIAEELDSLALRKQALSVEKRRLEKDSAYLERVARKDLGMARPDEKVFRFVPGDAGNDRQKK